MPKSHIFKVCFNEIFIEKILKSILSQEFMFIVFYMIYDI